MTTPDSPLRLSDYLHPNAMRPVPVVFGAGTEDVAPQSQTGVLALVLTPGNVTELAAAAYVFGVVDVTLRLPEGFAGKVWDERLTGRSVVDQRVLVVGRARGGEFVINVGARTMTHGFYRRRCVSATIQIARDVLSAASTDLFDLDRIRTDFEVP